MSEQLPAFGDPLTAPFWAAAARHEFVLQRCARCEAFQFYPRPFCLTCGGDDVAWFPSSGNGRIYSQTTVRVPVLPELPPPYVVALVELDEGVRFTAGLVGPPALIGDRVHLAWRERAGQPPLPVFTTEER